MLHAAIEFDTSTAQKEKVMQEAEQLEIVDLGDAKEKTKDGLRGPTVEDNPVLSYRRIS